MPEGVPGDSPSRGGNPGPAARRPLRLVDDTYLADQPVRSRPEVTALDRAELAEVKGAIRELTTPTGRAGRVFGTGSASRGRPLRRSRSDVKSRLTAARTALGRILDEKGQNR